MTCKQMYVEAVLCNANTSFPVWLFAVVGGTHASHQSSWWDTHPLLCHAIQPQGYGTTNVISHLVAFCIVFIAFIKWDYTILVSYTFFYISLLIPPTVWGADPVHNILQYCSKHYLAKAYMTFFSLKRSTSSGKLTSLLGDTVVSEGVPLISRIGTFPHRVFIQFTILNFHSLQCDNLSFWTTKDKCFSSLFDTLLFTVNH